MGAASALLKNRDHTHVTSEEPVSGVRPRPVLPENDGVGEAPTSVLRVRSPIERNHLHAAFRAIMELGMRIVKAEVRAVGREAIQTLHVLEADERAPTASRLSEARAALRHIHGPSHMVRPNGQLERPRGKRLRAALPTGDVKWPR
jgi:hypothetical protein